MKLVIFGATGTIGRHLVSQALTEGHQVTAFARTPNALVQPGDMAPENLTLLAGNVFDATSVANAVKDQDGALIALGGGLRGTVRSTGTRHIIQAMEQHGVRRLICQTTLGVGKSWENLNFYWKYLMFGLLLRPVFSDHVTQEAFVKKSRLDWVIVRPGAFVDGPATGTYQHGFSPQKTNLKLKISRADVAGFMLRQLKDNAYLQQTPGLSY